MIDKIGLVCIWVLDQDEALDFYVGKLGFTVRTDVEVAGRKRFRGEVVDAREDEATIAVGEDRFEIPYEAIVRGNLIEEGR